MTDDELQLAIDWVRQECRDFPVVRNLLAELPAMQNASKTLAALNAAGVDNWEGYSYAMELMEE